MLARSKVCALAGNSSYREGVIVQFYWHLVYPIFTTCAELRDLSSYRRSRYDALRYELGGIIMKNHRTTVAVSLSVLLSYAAQAEIYETTDAQGNKVFTDSPNEGAELVDLPDANIADSVKPMPRPEPGPETSVSRPPPAQPADQITIIGNDDYDRLESRIAREKRREILDGEPRREVGDGEPGHSAREPGPPPHAEQPRPLRTAPAVHPRR